MLFHFSSRSLSGLTFVAPLLRLGLVLGVFWGASAQASSTIFDGVIVEIQHGKDKKKPGAVLVVQVAHSPYSSPPALNKSTADKDGKQQLLRLPLRQFLTYYIDEVPVTREQMRSYLQPGMRMVTMENRAKWYFLSVTDRNNASQIGFLQHIEGNVLTLVRPQIAANEISPLTDKTRESTDANYQKRPHRVHHITLADDAVVQVAGKTIPWQQAGLKADPTPDHIKTDGLSPAEGKSRQRQFAVKAHQSRNSILVQAKREHMRVELMPPNYGDWQTLVNGVNTNPDYGPDKAEYQMKWQTLGVVRGVAEKGSYLTRGPGAGKSDQRQNAFGFAYHKLAGAYPYPNTEAVDITMPIYHKGLTSCVDGFYPSFMRGWHSHAAIQPGRFIVATQRRKRVTTDRALMSSENPIAWGTITAIDGNTITLEAPEIADVPVSGKQTIEIPGDATVHHVGQVIERSAALRVGSLIHVFAARPQTVVVNAGR